MNQRTKLWTRRILPLGLLLVGLSQMAGDLCGLAGLKGLGAATMVAPAPRVFSTVKGLETFSTAFSVTWVSPDGKPKQMELDQPTYDKLRGPYNRRNAYGAILAYGPVLATSDVAAPMYDSASRYALCDEAPVLDELGIPVAERPDAVTIHYKPRPGVELTEVPSELEVVCQR